MLLILGTQWTAEKQGALVGSRGKKSPEMASLGDWGPMPGAFQQARLTGYVSYTTSAPQVNMVAPTFPEVFSGLHTSLVRCQKSFSQKYHIYTSWTIFNYFVWFILYSQPLKDFEVKLSPTLLYYIQIIQLWYPVKDILIHFQNHFKITL